MTAALALVPRSAELAEIERLERAIDEGLAAALGSLTALRERQAHRARGFALWHEYVLARFGEALAKLRLPDGERLALVDSMCTRTPQRPRGLPVREQARVLGVSVGTVQNDRSALGKVIPLGRRSQPVHDPHAGLNRTQEILARVTAAGEHGLTSLELDAATDWPAGTATGLLSRLERRGLVRRIPTFRQRRAAYVAT